MYGWLMMVRKDFRLGLPWLWTGSLFIVCGHLSVAWLLEGQEQLLATLYLLFSHLLFFGLYLILTLSAEAQQLHQWLHVPRPAWQLLLSKIWCALLAATLTFVLSSLYPFSLLVDGIGWVTGLERFFTAYLHLTWFALRFGLILMLIFVLQTVFSFGKGKDWILGLSLLLLILFAPSVSSWILPVGWGGWPDWVQLFEQGAALPLSTLAIGGDGLLMGACFTASSWLLEKRTEV